MQCLTVAFVLLCICKLTYAAGIPKSETCPKGTYDENAKNPMLPKSCLPCSQICNPSDMITFRHNCKRLCMDVYNAVLNPVITTMTNPPTIPWTMSTKRDLEPLPVKSQDKHISHWMLGLLVVLLVFVGIGTTAGVTVYVKRRQRRRRRKTVHGPNLDEEATRGNADRQEDPPQFNLEENFLSADRPESIPNEVLDIQHSSVPLNSGSGSYVAQRPVCESEV